MGLLTTCDFLAGALPSSAADFSLHPVSAPARIVGVVCGWFLVPGKSHVFSLSLDRFCLPSGSFPRAQILYHNSTSINMWPRTCMSTVVRYGRGFRPRSHSVPGPRTDFA
jgi:hypothetical protein